MSKSTKTTDQSQIDRFKEAARELEADESEAAFDEKLKMLAKNKVAKKIVKKDDT